MLLTAGCAKKASESQSPDAGGLGGDDIVALEQQLAQREGELRAVGVAPAPYAATPAPQGGAGDVNSDSAERTTTMGAADPAPSSEPAPTTTAPSSEQLNRSEEEPGRCQRVCEIAAAICALEDQICGLVPRHRDDARYQAACDRSAADCQLANEACHACNPT